MFKWNLPISLDSCSVCWILRVGSCWNQKPNRFSVLWIPITCWHPELVLTTLGNDAALCSQRSGLALGREIHAALLEIKNTDSETRLWWARWWNQAFCNVCYCSWCFILLVYIMFFWVSKCLCWFDLFKCLFAKLHSYRKYRIPAHTIKWDPVACPCQETHCFF